MEISYEITEEFYKDVVGKIRKKLNYYVEGIAQILCILSSINVYLEYKNRFTSILTPLINTIVCMVIGAVFVHYVFNKLQPRLLIKMAVKNNKKTIGKITFYLQDDYFKLLSSGELVVFKCNKVLAVKEVDTAYCIIIPRKRYIVIPKKSEFEHVHEDHYKNNLEIIIEEIKRRASFKSKLKKIN